MECTISLSTRFKTRCRPVNLYAHRPVKLYANIVVREEVLIQLPSMKDHVWQMY